MTESAIQHPNVIRKVSAKTVFLKAKAFIEKDDSRGHLSRIFYDMESTRDIKIFDFDCFININSLSRGGWGGQNALLATATASSAFIPFYPHNDGSPTCPFVYYRKEAPCRNHVLFMDNQMDFTEVKNLDQVLVKLVTIMHEAYGKGIPIHPFQSFLLEFPWNVTKETIENAKIAMCIPDPPYSGMKDLDRWLANSQNVFLDHFLGWNFGDIIRSNRELEAMVLDYHLRMVNDGKRKYAGSGFEVTCRTNDTGIDNFYNFPGLKK